MQLRNKISNYSFKTQSDTETFLALYIDYGANAFSMCDGMFAFAILDKKFNKLIDLSSKLAVHSTELESSVTGQLKDSAQKEDTRTTKVDLANEKLSRLIEILKAVVKEQAKLDPVAKALSDIQKKQKALQKAQAGFIKDQAAVKEALADLRRKANVNISRSDDIKKTLGKLGPAKK
jgi:hypothetical protein